MISRWFRRPAPQRRSAVALLLGALLMSLLRPAAAAPATAPILLVVNDVAITSLGRYVGESLRAEGLNAYDIAQLKTITADDLNNHRLVILPQVPLTAAQAALLSGYVNGGGRLLALRPEAQIAPLFGLMPAGGVETDGYLKIDGSQPAGRGLPIGTLQIHGQADRYTLNGATMVATLYRDATTATENPAVVIAGEGRTAAFTYDLAKNIALTRQGNPANADVDVDGDGTFRTIDLFQSKNGAPWVDRDKIAIPQADVQQRLFVRLVQQLLDGVTPLPQLWYFPGTAKTMLIPTGDAHANPVDYYRKEIDSVKAHGGTMTFFLSQAGDPPDATLQQWIKEGFSFGIHPYANKPDPNPSVNIASLNQGYDIFAQWFTAAFSSPPSRTVRAHQLAWKGWTDAADIAVAHGIALDADFYHWGPWIKRPDGTWPRGYITGSGQPMKFVRADGTILPLYQQLTELADEHLVAGIPSGEKDENLTAAQAITASQQLIDASLAGDYAALMTQFHVDTYGFGDPQVWAEGTLDYARAKVVPIWNADQWLRFTEIRHDAQFQDVAWDQASGQLSFTLSTTATSDMLSVLLPPTFAARKLESVQVDGAAAEPTDFAVAGRMLALISVKAGTHTFAARYSSPQATPAPAVTVQPAAPTGVSAGAASAAPVTPAVPVVPPSMLAISGAVRVVVAVVAFLVGRGRPGRG